MNNHFFRLSHCRKLAQRQLGQGFKSTACTPHRASLEELVNFKSAPRPTALTRNDALVLPTKGKSSCSLQNKAYSSIMGVWGLKPGGNNFWQEGKGSLCSNTAPAWSAHSTAFHSQALTSAHLRLQAWAGSFLLEVFCVALETTAEHRELPLVLFSPGHFLSLLHCSSKSPYFTQNPYILFFPLPLELKNEVVQHTPECKNKGCSSYFISLEKLSKFSNGDSSFCDSKAASSMKQMALHTQFTWQLHFLRWRQLLPFTTH